MKKGPKGVYRPPLNRGDSSRPTRRSKSFSGPKKDVKVFTSLTKSSLGVLILQHREKTLNSTSVCNTLFRLYTDVFVLANIFTNTSGLLFS